MKSLDVISKFDTITGIEELYSGFEVIVHGNKDDESIEHVEKFTSKIISELFIAEIKKAIK